MSRPRHELANGLLLGAEPSEAATARSITERCPQYELGAGESRNLDGDVALLVVRSGLVVIRSSSAGGARQLVTSDAAAGTVLPGPRPYESLTALRRSLITAVPREARDRLLELPAVARGITEELERAARRAREQAEIFGSKRTRDRVRQRLIQLARDHGRVTTAGVRIDFPLTHELLGAMIGSARESVTRAVDELERAGFLERDGRHYRLVVAPEDLRETRAEALAVQALT